MSVDPHYEVSVASDVMSGKVDRDDLTEYLETMYTLGDNAVRKDEQEYQNAMAAVTTAGPNCGFDKETTRARIEELIRQMYDAFEKVSATMKGIPEMCDYEQEIRSKVAPGWDAVVAELEGIREEMAGLGIEGWEGSAADAYRCRIDGDSQRADKHINLSKNAGAAIKGVADIQGSITLTTLNIFRIALNNAQAAFGPVQTFSPGAAWNPFANYQEYHFSFYSRTAAMMNAAQNINEQLQRLFGGDPWQPSAAQIRDNLGTAISFADNGNDLMPNYKLDDYQMTVKETDLVKGDVGGTYMSR